jgi:hypothetical protein
VFLLYNLLSTEGIEMPDLLIEMRRGVLAHRQFEDSQERAFAAILEKLRGDEPPNPTDLAAAGVSSADVEHFRDVLRQERDLQTAITETTELEEAAAGAINRHAEFVAAEREKIEAPIREAARLLAIARTAAQELAEVKRSEHNLRSLYASNWRLFGIPQPPAEPTAGMIPQGTFLPRTEPAESLPNLANCYPRAPERVE